MANVWDIIINNFPVILIAIISVIGGNLLPRLKATPAEKTDSFIAINKSFETLSDKYKDQASDWEERYKKTEKAVSKLQNEIEVMKGEIILLNDYRRKYYSLVDWAEDIYLIAKKSNIDIPLLSSEVMNDIKMRKSSGR